MKTVLIATDFSTASRNAEVYGVEFARAINAKIILFNAYMISKPVPAVNLIKKKGIDIMMQTDKLLLDEANIFDPRLTSMEIQCDEGLAADAVINIANEKKVDFIIAGMKGSGKTFRKI